MILHNLNTPPDNIEPVFIMMGNITTYEFNENLSASTTAKTHKRNNIMIALIWIPRETNPNVFYAKSD